MNDKQLRLIARAIALTGNLSYNKRIDFEHMIIEEYKELEGMAKKVCTVEDCIYCPYMEKLQVKEKTKENPLIEADFYKCNKLQVCVEVGKTYLKNPEKHLFKFCPLQDAD